MSNRTLNLDDKLYQYLLSHSLRETPVQSRLRERTAALPERGMQISPEQAQFMALIVELMGAEHILEVGTFTGYSALCMALALPDQGELVCCDISREYTDIGKPFWQEAGVDDRIELRIAPAIETLDSLLSEGRAGHFDLAFVDADKTNYENYFERCLTLLRTGGLMMIDNTLWGGSVANPEKNDPDTQALRQLNKKLHKDDRVTLSLLPIGDGLTLARKR